MILKTSVRRRVATIATVLSVAVFAAAACGDDDDDADSGAEGGATTASAESGQSSVAASSAPSSGGDVELATGGTITVISPTDSQTLDPLIGQLQSTTDGLRFAAIYDTLFYTDAVTGEVVPRIAESIEPNDDYTAWTVRIRPGVTFSDGTPYDAAAVKFNIDRAADPDNKGTQYNLAKDLVTTVVDDTTLEITLPQPNPQFAHVMAQSFSIIASPTAVQADPQGFGENPVGAGPFVLKEWVRDDHLDFERNPTYWQEGRPYLDGVEIKVVSDPNQQINAVVNGDADALNSISAETMQLGEEAGLNTLQTEVGGGTTLDFNTSEPPFDDRRARLAIANALDLAEFNDVVFEGRVSPPTALFASTSPYYDSAYDIPAADPTVAQQLFDELAAEGKPVSFTYLTFSAPLPTRIAEYIQSRLATYDNVEMTIEAKTPADYFADRRTGQFQTAQSSFWFVHPYPTMVETLRTDGSLNYMQFSSPEMDAALEAAVSASDEGARKEAYGEVQAIFLQERPLLILSQTRAGFVHNDRLGGLRTFQLGSIPFWDEIGIVE